MTAANGVKKARGAIPGRQVRAFGRWRLAGCLLLAALLVGGANFGSASAPARRAIAVASHRQASKSIETICVGQRVVTQDAQANGNSGDAHLISFCCGKSFVAFRSAKGDDPANSAFRNRYQ